jgi:DNA-binding FadR family transcriptional regulator
VFEPLSRRSLAADVFHQLRARIVGGEAAPGSALPAERTLASLLKVNRNAVREGLKRLEQAGLVAIHQGGPTRVLDFRRTAGLELLATLLVRPDGSIAVDVVRGIVEFRSAIAPAIGRFAAERASPEVAAAIDAVVRDMRAAGGDVQRLARLALDFWKCVVAATKNVVFELAFNSLAVSYGAVVDQLSQVMADEAGATDDYEALARAIAAGEAERAAKLSVAITARGARAFDRVLEALADDGKARARPRRRRS